MQKLRLFLQNPYLHNTEQSYIKFQDAVQRSKTRELQRLRLPEDFSPFISGKLHIINLNINVQIVSIKSL